MDHLRFLESVCSPDHATYCILSIAGWNDTRHSPCGGKYNVFLATTFRSQEATKEQSIARSSVFTASWAATGGSSSASSCWLNSLSKLSCVERCFSAVSWRVSDSICSLSAGIFVPGSRLRFIEEGLAFSLAWGGGSSVEIV